MNSSLPGPNPATAASEPTIGKRLHGLDALRGGALLLGIVLHSLMPFLPGGGWMLTDLRTGTGPAMAVGVIHLFRMVLFMMLAGFFGRLVLHRRGTRAYLRDRGLRILLPLLVFGPLALLSVAAVVELDRVVNGTAPSPVSEGGSPLSLLLVAPAHLWFLNVLLQCVVITVAVRAVLVATLGTERLDGWTRRAGNLLAVPAAGVAVAAAPYLLTLLLQGRAAAGIEQPTTILPEPVPLIGYLGAFLVGWCLHARDDALTRIARAWPWNLAAALTLTIAPSFGVTQPPAVVALVVALAGWTATLGLLGVCVRFLRRDHAGIRYLADASYWMYLLHLPVLLLIEVFLAELPWPIVAKLLLTWTISAAVLLLSYDLLVRDTWLGRWLTGHRRPALSARGSVRSTALAQKRW